MPDITCPSCGHRTEGPFCSQCGARVAGATACSACGNSIPDGGRFCNQCGAPAAAATAAGASVVTPASVPATPRKASTLPWVVTGFAILALVIALIFPRPNPEPATSTAPAIGGPGAGAPGSEFGDAASVDLASMTPRQRADALFNRVMENVSSGDSTQAGFFLPMALRAYEDVPDLDADGHYHVAVLHLSGGDPQAARARADSILADAPQHLFGLFTAAQAEQAMGNTEAARELYRRFRDSFAAETALGRTEYSEHQGVMPMMQEEARRAVGE